jgi:hypothetical protein
VNLPKLKKFKIKYGWREIEIGNNVSYICFSRFEMEFELKFRELDFNEIWLASSLLHLIARKNKFPAKEYKKFEFPLKMEFGLILL